MEQLSSHSHEAIKIDSSNEYHTPSFLYDIKVLEEEGIVIKTPRSTLHTSGEQEKEGLAIHQKYLGNAIPKTTINSTDNGFNVHQEYIDGSPVDLATTMNPQVIKLLEAGEKMQAKERILFDVFGIEGMVRLFNHYYSDSTLGNMNDIALPMNAQYLSMMHNFPPELITKLRHDNDKPPFIAYNIREEPNGKVYFVETNNRSLRWNSVFNPLNGIGSWITRKALNDLKKQRNKN